jgi:hypothetical protein
MSIKTNPTAGVVVYNYKDRGGANYISSQDVDKYKITGSIISISTSKTKSSPAGTFEIRLAPTRNWVSLISVGSWIEIHMAPHVITSEDLDASSKKTLKMIGVIDSVRVNVSVNQSTGARSTEYTLIGRDWGSALESYLYIDSAIVSREDDALKKAFKIGYKSIFGDVKSESFYQKWPSLSLVEKIIRIWGVESALSYSTNSIDTPRFAPIAEFVLPKELHAKTNSTGKNSLASSIKIINGRLSGYDKYKSGEIESIGLIDVQRLIGTNTVWQLLNVHSNNIVNELIADLRWEENSEKPIFSLYKRVKPFWLPDQKAKKNEQEKDPDPKIISSFLDIRKVPIKKELVLSVNAGDNTRDIINFIEITTSLTSSMFFSEELAVGIQANIKNKGATYDPASFARHGIKPLFLSTNFYPVNKKNIIDYKLVLNWLPVLKKWFFDCHKMLNGSISIIGKADYIGVGDNILIDSEVFGDLNYISGQIGSNFSDFKVLAHVESVSHTFSYVNNRSRNFITNITFTRGIVTNSDGTKQIDSDSFAIDTSSTSIETDSYKNKRNFYTPEIKK